MNDKPNYSPVKQALVSVLIGTAISFCTLLLQEIVGMLRNLDAGLIGATWGMIRNELARRQSMIS